MIAESRIAAMNRGTDGRVGQASSLSAPNRQDACPTLAGSWKASTIPESRIGTMNRRRTGARTALSASSLDLIRADMAVRAPIGGSWEGNTSKIRT